MSAQILYPEFVHKLVKPGDSILASLSGEDCNLIHMALGVCGEAGELADAIKKATIYRKPVDIKNVLEELGDLKFFMTEIMNHFNFTEADVEAANMAKLMKRYESLTYSDKEAQERKDKVE
jgi:NTP pyrophosphatase (non-canonical NTP hydrolase)